MSSLLQSALRNIKLLNYVDEYDPDVQKHPRQATYRLTMDGYFSYLQRTDGHLDRLEGRLPHDL